MRKVTLFAGPLLLFALFNWQSYAVANEGGDHSMQELKKKASLEDLKAAPSMAEDGTINLNNQVCPVSGDKVSGKNIFKHDGINYQMCCGMCDAKFEKNPAKYAVSKEAVMAKIGH